MTERAVTTANVAAAVKCELAGDIVRAFGALRCPAMGWSMLPTVFPGDTLMVERVSPVQVCVGDVVVAGREGKLCAHRVIGMSNELESRQWITQGDAVPIPDRPVLANELLGRVNYLIRAGRLIKLRATLSSVESLVAKVIRHSEPAARVLVYLHKIVQIPEANLPCQE